MTFLSGSYLGEIVESEYQEMADDHADTAGLSNDRALQAMQSTYEEMERTHAHHFGTRPNIRETPSPSAPQQVATATRVVSFQSQPSGPSTASVLAPTILSLPSRIADPGAPQLMQVQSRAAALSEPPRRNQPPPETNINISVSANEQKKLPLPLILGAAVIGAIILLAMRKG